MAANHDPAVTVKTPARLHRPMLEASDLRKAYGEVQAVRSIRVHVKAGHIVGMVGNNGAGKTTTIKMLTGLVTPDAGQIRAVDGDPRDAPVRQHIGYLPEQSPLYDDQTPLAYLRFFASLYDITAEDAETRSKDLLTRLRLDEEYWNKPIGDLSKGSARKVAIARCLLHDPPILILDEPTSGLDPRSRRDLDELLLEKRREGKAILLSAHDLKQVEDLCDEVIVVHEGKVVTQGPLAGLRKSWGIQRYHVRANAAFPGSSKEGPLHVATVRTWSEVEAAIAGAKEAGGQVVDVINEPPRLDEILHKVVEG